MTLAQALKQATHLLNINGIEDSHVEARILLGHVMKLSPTQIYSQPEKTLSQEEERDLQELIERRLCREPSAYIVKHKEFYGIGFYVDSRVLIPRPETELLVDAALEFAKGDNFSLSVQPRPILIADVGTGCGAIAISIALNLPQSKVYATDISSSALEVARLNCQNHRVTEQVVLLHGNLLEPVPEPVDVIVANLPYIRSSELPNLSPEIVKYEPRIAIDGGSSGLELVQQLLGQVVGKVNRRGCLLLEIGQDQEKEVVSLILRCFKIVQFEFVPDLSGINRVVKVIFETA